MRSLTILRRVPPLHAMVLIPLLALVAGAYWAAPARSVPDNMPSHLTARALLLPPPALSQPIADDGPAIKGMNPVAERALLDALSVAGLRERILKVAVAEEGGAPVALVKVQAGDAQSRLFSVEAVEADAAQALAVAFGLATALRHVDFWAVVPGLDGEGETVHRPVFSVAAERSTYLQLLKGNARTNRDLLAGLSAVRYDPVFTRHAVDWTSASPTMPRTAYWAPRLCDIWAEMVSEAHSALGGGGDAPGTVSAILGGVPNGGKVALTIDDGPHPLITPLFLDILRRENAKATFFIVGEKAEEFPGLVREIAREGHELGNHTYSHRRFSGLSAAEAYAEMRGCSRIISTLTGEVPRYMRPPGGDYTATSLQVAERLGLVTALWTHNTGDWRKPEPTAIAYNATRDLQTGDIILMHQGDMQSVKALPMILQRIRAKGLAPAPLGALAAAPGVSRRIAVADALAERRRLSLAE